MLYYQIPLGADKQQSEHQFGLRFDQTNHDPRDVVQIDVLESRPAAMDFRMGYNGVQSINLHGTDYAKYLIARAAEDESPEAVDAGSVDESATQDETGAADTSQQGNAKTLTQAVSDMPVGVIMGVVIGLLILAGAGG